jgi:putative ATPase
LKNRKITIKEENALFRYSGGDARKLLNIIEIVVNSIPNGDIEITDKIIEAKLQQNFSDYDKNGELHYDIISAFIKSIRGSDPDAAIYWLARMIAGGEDPKFIARRLIISAAEDIGLANPNALLLANSCFDALQKIGWPEGRIILAETTIYLAASQKSNSAYLAIDKALEFVNKTGNIPVPLSLRNAPTYLMKELGYGEDYKYSHDYKNHFTKQDFLPKEIKDARFWEIQGSPQEKKMGEWINFLWEDRYKQ